MAAVADRVVFNQDSKTLQVEFTDNAGDSQRSYYVLQPRHREQLFQALKTDRKARRAAQRADMNAEYDVTNPGGW